MRGSQHISCMRHFFLCAEAYLAFYAGSTETGGELCSLKKFRGEGKDLQGRHAWKTWKSQGISTISWEIREFWNMIGCISLYILHLFYIFRRKQVQIIRVYFNEEWVFEARPQFTNLVVWLLYSKLRKASF